MRPSRRRRVMAEINIVPFTDVCLVLLIIMFVASSFLATDAALNLRLPRAASAQVVQADEYLVVTVDREGAYFVNSEPVAAGELLSALESHRPAYGDRPVVVKCDDASSWGDAVRAMDIIRMAGYGNIAIAVNVSKPEE
jgi:biopolymer transport protein TolR